MEHHNANRKPRVFDFFSDAAHGWMFVPWTTFHELKINPSIFSRYSYADEHGAYLEEDCDLGLFEELFCSRTEQRIVFNNVADIAGDVRMKRSIRDFLVVLN